jgi:GT2 family glycosyltransferase
VSENYKPTFAEHVSESQPGDFMTGNIAYKRNIVEKVGRFDEKYSCHEDRDFGLRILKFGDIKFNQKMLVYVQKQVLTPKQYLQRTNAIKNRVYLFKKFHDTQCIVWRVVDPISLGFILFPPLIFSSLFSYKFKTKDDFNLVPFKYLHLLSARLQLWRESAKERVLLI